jgi:8-oxo-dGTP pyrophosphatase MutT (NUDIX family)
MVGFAHPTKMLHGDDTNPWTTLESRPVYDNPWISVREDQVLRPDGSPGIYGVVHFKGRAIGILPVEGDGSVWLVGQYRYPLNRFSWEIPEGGAPDGEFAEEAAVRELREETGLVAGRLEALGGEVHLSNSATDESGRLFRATHLTPGPNDPEATEQLHVRCFSWDDAWAMLESGEITDSLSVIALLREAVLRARSGTDDM